MYYFAKIGCILHFGSMTKNGQQKFLWMEIDILFLGKGQIQKFEKFLMASEDFSEIGRNLKQREMHHCLRGDLRPWI